MDNLQTIMDEYLQRYEDALAQQSAQMQAREAKERDELAQKETRLRAWLADNIPASMVEYATFVNLQSLPTHVTLNLPRSFPCSFSIFEDGLGFRLESVKRPYRVPTRACIAPAYDECNVDYTKWETWESLPAALGHAQWLWREYQPVLLEQWAEWRAEEESFHAEEDMMGSSATLPTPEPTPEQPQLTPLERIAAALETIAYAQSSAAW